jgi:hypothetical protein
VRRFRENIVLAYEPTGVGTSETTWISFEMHPIHQRPFVRLMESIIAEASASYGGSVKPKCC